jgi:hypothetical protein
MRTNVTTLAGFAKHRGVSKAAVTKWKARGLLVFTAAGKIDVAASDSRLADRPKVYRGGPVKSAPGLKPSSVVDLPPADNPATWTTAEAIRHKEIAQARLRQIEADTAAGLVVPIADIADAVRNEYAIVRAAFLGMSAKLAHRLAAATTPHEAGALVDGEVRAVLSALTQDTAKHDRPAS